LKFCPRGCAPAIPSLSGYAAIERILGSCTGDVASSQAVSGGVAELGGQFRPVSGTKTLGHAVNGAGGGRRAGDFHAGGMAAGAPYRREFYGAKKLATVISMKPLLEKTRRTNDRHFQVVPDQDLQEFPSAGLPQKAHACIPVQTHRCAFW